MPRQLLMPGYIICYVANRPEIVAYRAPLIYPGKVFLHHNNNTKQDENNYLSRSFRQWNDQQ